MRDCFERLVEAPAPSRMNERRVVKLIVELRRSELEKAGCGDRVVGIWDGYAAAVRAAKAK